MEYFNDTVNFSVTNTSSFLEETYKNDYLVATMFLVTSFFGLITYVPCLVAMCKSKQLKSPCYTFMISLGISDCTSLIGWVVIGIDTCTHGLVVPKPAITVVLCFLVIGWGSLTTHEAMTAINRYIAVCHASKHDSMFSQNKMKILLGVSWFYAIGIHAAATFVPPNMFYSLDGYYALWADDNVTKYYTYEDITCCSLVFSICVFSYASIMIKFARVRRQVSPNPKQTIQSKGKAYRDKKNAAFQFKLALQTSIRCVTFFVYDVLYYLVSLYSTNLWAIFICSTYLWCLNNALNPWVYLIFNDQLRKVLKQYVFGGPVRTNKTNKYEATAAPKLGPTTIGMGDIARVN